MKRLKCPSEPHPAAQLIPRVLITAGDDGGNLGPDESTVQNQMQLSCPAKAGHPVRCGLSIENDCLWNAGSPGRAGR